jgi:hypothetical protein
MCGICGSNDYAQFTELMHENIKRGSFSCSLTAIDVRSYRIIDQIKTFDTEKLGNLLSKLKTGSGIYYIGHTQAPTGGLIRNKSRIHPSRIVLETPSTITDTSLWHNGVLTEAFMKENAWDPKMWDTELIHTIIFNDGIKALSDVKGSFACVYLRSTSSLKVFRNPQAPIFWSANAFSSLPFKGSAPLGSNCVYSIDKSGKLTKTTEKFDGENIYGL